MYKFKFIDTTYFKDHSYEKIIKVYPQQKDPFFEKLEEKTQSQNGDDGFTLKELQNYISIDRKTFKHGSIVTNEKKTYELHFEESRSIAFLTWTIDRQLIEDVEVERDFYHDAGHIIGQHISSYMNGDKKRNIKACDFFGIRSTKKLNRKEMFASDSSDVNDPENTIYIHGRNIPTYNKNYRTIYYESDPNNSNPDQGSGNLFTVYNNEQWDIKNASAVTNKNDQGLLITRFEPNENNQQSAQAVYVFNFVNSSKKLDEEPFSAFQTLITDCMYRDNISEMVNKGKMPFKEPNANDQNSTVYILEYNTSSFERNEILLNRLKKDLKSNELPFFIFMGGYGSKKEGKSFRPFETLVKDGKLSGDFKFDLFEKEAKGSKIIKPNTWINSKEPKKNYKDLVFDNKKSLRDHVVHNLESKEAYPHDYAFVYHMSLDNTIGQAEKINEVLQKNGAAWKLFEENKKTYPNITSLKDKSALTSIFFPSVSQYRLRINSFHYNTANKIQDLSISIKYIKTNVVDYKKNDYIPFTYDEDINTSDEQTGGVGISIEDKDAINQKRNILMNDNTNKLVFEPNIYSISRLSLKLHVRFLENDISIRKTKEITPKTILDSEDVDERFNQRKNTDTTHFVVPLDKCTLSYEVVEKYFKSLQNTDDSSKFGWREIVELFRSENNLINLLRHLHKTTRLMRDTKAFLSDDDVLRLYRNFIWTKLSSKIMREIVDTTKMNGGYKSTVKDIASFLRDYYSYWKYLIFSYDGNVNHDQIPYSTDRYSKKNQSDWDQQYSRINSKIRELMRTPNDLPIFNILSHISPEETAKTLLNNSHNMNDYLINDKNMLKDDMHKLSYIFHALMLRSDDEKKNLYHDVFQISSDVDDDQNLRPNDKYLDSNLLEFMKKNPISLKPMMRLAQWYDLHKSKTPTFDGSFRFSYADDDNNRDEDVSLRFKDYYNKDDNKYDNDIKQIIVDSPNESSFFYKQILLPSQIETFDKEQKYTKQLYHIQYRGEKTLEDDNDRNDIKNEKNRPCSIESHPTDDMIFHYHFKKYILNLDNDEDECQMLQSKYKSDLLNNFVSYYQIRITNAIKYMDALKKISEKKLKEAENQTSGINNVLINEQKNTLKELNEFLEKLENKKKSKDIWMGSLSQIKSDKNPESTIPPFLKTDFYELYYNLCQNNTSSKSLPDLFKSQFYDKNPHIKREEFEKYVKHHINLRRSGASNDTDTVVNKNYSDFFEEDNLISQLTEYNEDYKLDESCLMNNDMKTLNVNAQTNLQFVVKTILHNIPLMVDNELIKVKIDQPADQIFVHNHRQGMINIDIGYCTNGLPQIPHNRNVDSIFENADMIKDKKTKEWSASIAKTCAKNRFNIVKNSKVVIDKYNEIDRNVRENLREIRVKMLEEDARLDDIKDQYMRANERRFNRQVDALIENDTVYKTPLLDLSKNVLNAKTSLYQKVNAKRAHTGGVGGGTQRHKRGAWNPMLTLTLKKRLVPKRSMS